MEKKFFANRCSAPTHNAACAQGSLLKIFTTFEKRLMRDVSFYFRVFITEHFIFFAKLRLNSKVVALLQIVTIQLKAEKSLTDRKLDSESLLLGCCRAIGLKNCTLINHVEVMNNKSDILCSFWGLNNKNYKFYVALYI